VNRKRAQKIAREKLPQIEEIQGMRKRIAYLEMADLLLRAVVDRVGGTVHLTPADLRNPPRIRAEKTVDGVMLSSVYLPASLPRDDRSPELGREPPVGLPGETQDQADCGTCDDSPTCIEGTREAGAACPPAPTSCADCAADHCDTCPGGPLNPDTPIEQVRAELRAAGYDPEAVGRRGEELAKELLAKRKAAKAKHACKDCDAKGLNCAESAFTTRPDGCPVPTKKKPLSGYQKRKLKAERETQAAKARA